MDDGKISDYLGLWQHYENRAQDDKNRAISTSSLLIGLSGALLGASISAQVAAPPAPKAALLLAILGFVLAALSCVMVKVFDDHSRRNYTAANVVKCNLTGHVETIFNEITRSRGAVPPSEVKQFLSRLFGFLLALSAIMVAACLLAAGWATYVVLF